MPLFSPNKDSMFIIYNQDRMLREGTIQVMRTEYKLLDNGQEKIVTRLE